MIINPIGGAGAKINGLIEEYVVAAGENISAGDFVQFINKYASGDDTPINESTVHTGNFTFSAQLDSTHVFIASRDNIPSLYGVVCTISGTTITVGVNALLFSMSAVPISVVALNPYSVFISFGDSSSYYLYGVVCTISGTTITVGTDTQIVSSSVAVSAIISSAQVDSTHVFIVHPYNFSYYYLHGIICTISGTTITHGADTVLSDVVYSGASCSVVKVDSSHAFIAHRHNNSDLYLSGMICSTSGTNIISNLDSVISEAYYSGAGTNPSILINSYIFIAHNYGNPNYYLYGIVVNPSILTLVESYSDTINGLAKTAGAAGETISVYVPE